MSKQWQIRRGTTAENNEFTGAVGEITMDTDKNQIRLHDGVTQGGHIFGDTVVEWQVPTAENNYTWYRKYASGWVEQGGFCSGTAEDNPVIMPIEMRDTEYQVSAIADPTDLVNGWGWLSISRNTKTTTGFSLGCRYGAGNVLPVRTHWQVSGMAA